MSITGSLLNYLRRQRAQLDETLTRRGLAHTFSLASSRLHRQLKTLIAAEARGDCLDAGSGRSPYKRQLEQLGLSVTSIDVEDRMGEIDMIADIQDMPQVDDSSKDTILCTQVLEHVPRPWEAMTEFARVLRPGGVLILSVPHLSLIHEAPHDYYRYTRFGLTALCDQSGLDVVELRPSGGVWCFLGHGCSLVLMCTLGSVPVLRWAVWLVNFLLLVCALGIVDRLFGFPGIYPCDYVMLARKPVTT